MSTASIVSRGARCTAPPRESRAPRGWCGGHPRVLPDPCHPPHARPRRAPPSPSSGKGSIVYVIAAYNRFTTVRIGGVTSQLIGLEWAYAGPCPPTRACGPDLRSIGRVRRGGLPRRPHRVVGHAELRPSLSQWLRLRADGPDRPPHPLGSGLRLDPHDRPLPVSRRAHLLRRLRLQLLPGRRHGLGRFVHRSRPAPGPIEPGRAVTTDPSRGLVSTSVNRF